MARVRAQVERVEVVGLDEAYLDLDGLVAPRAAMRRLVEEIRAETGLDCSVGIGPNRLVAKVASDAEKPRGFVVLTREQACARFGRARAGARARHRPEDGGAAGAAGDHDPGRAGRGAAGAARRRVRRQPRPGPAAPRALRGLGRADAGARSPSPSRARRRSTPTSPITRAGGDPRRPRRPALRAAGRAGAPRAQRRDQGPPRRLHDGHAGAHDRRVVNDGPTVAAIAVELLREYAPARPVRLLGVRVAAFETVEPASADQLALPL